MSIIHEALKKVQMRMKKSNPKTEDVVEYLPSSSVDKPSTSKYSLFHSILIIVVCLVVIGVSCILGYIRLKYPPTLSKSDTVQFNKQVEKTFKSISIPNLLKPLTSSKETKPSQAISKPQTPSPNNTPVAQKTEPIAPNVSSNTPATTVAKPITSAPTSPDEINLQGIMSNTTGNVALINNNIYEEGVVLPNGARIIKINLQNITIEKNGKEEIITVSR